MPETRVDLGWRNSSAQAALAFFPPEPLGPEAGPLAGRVLRVRSPFSLRVRVSPPAMKKVLFQRVPEPGGLTKEGYDGLVSPIVPSALRDPAIPALQISLNLHLICDEPCSINLMPPFLEPHFRDWPGTIVCGRFPLRAWPRPLNAILEWEDRTRDWVIRRGDALAYLWVHFDDPDKVPNVVEAKLTPGLRRQIAQLNDVGRLGRNVDPMFKLAESRRPERLVVPKEIAAPWEAAE